ncbi:DUF6350 family protein [Herbiconiux moechotypicola]|uniref:Integral membrane protein n=1 Tax=Herbiconiux moechotypicola TaxID=637393 RepID=A0ABN3DSD8_9MICO|nr:DUF6350 family protein [Herbiconiux moechotypicola]MCS5730625.1 DUF6350 family protein [Herbiconiux moechotypicola]
MNRPATVFLAALDALVAAAIGIGVALVPLTVLWATQFGLAIDWLVFWRAAGDLWLLGNGVDLLVTIDPDTALRLGVAGAEAPFEVGFAPLGLAAVTLLLGARSGRRLSATPYPVTGAIAGALTMAGLGLLVCLTTRDPAALASLGQSILLPAAIFTGGVVVGYLWLPRRTPSPELAPGSPLARGWGSVRDLVPSTARGLIAIALRGGAIAAGLVLGFAALAMAIILVTGFAGIVALYESLQAGLVGGITLTLAQLAMLPNLVVWTASWFVGPGFAIGAGSAVSPLGTNLGLVPALPVLGALPQGTPALGFAGLVVPVAAAFVTAAALRPAVVDALGARPGRMLRGALAGLGLGAVGASILALLALWAGGAAGPGRLAEVGPDAGAVWLWAFVEMAPAALLGLVAGVGSRERSRNGSREGARAPAPEAHEDAEQPR